MWKPIMMNDSISETCGLHGITMEIAYGIGVGKQEGCNPPSGPAPHAHASNPGDRQPTQPPPRENGI